MEHKQRMNKCKYCIHRKMMSEIFLRNVSEVRFTDSHSDVSTLKSTLHAYEIRFSKADTRISKIVKLLCL